MSALFTSAVGQIYDAATDPSRWPVALQAVADCFDDVGAVMMFSREDGTFGAIVSPSLIPLVLEYQNDFKGQDLRAIRGVERGIFLNRDIATDRDVVSEEEMETHPYYMLLARHGLRYFVSAVISPTPQINVSIAVQRSIAKPAYNEAEMVLMEQLGRHAERSLRLSMRLLDAELVNIGLRDALSRIGIGVFALDFSGQVVFLNAAGTKLLGDGLTIVDRRLRIAPSVARADIEKTIAQILQIGGGDHSSDTKPILLERSQGKRQLAIYVLPVGEGKSPAQEVLMHARVLILAIDPQLDDPPDAALVRDLLGVTLSEARLASLVGSGMGPSQAAKKLGVTEETARTTLKRVFSKVGVSRQSELTALLTRLVLR